MFGENKSSRRSSTTSESSSSSNSAVVAAYATACNIDAWAFEAIDGIDWEIVKMFVGIHCISTEIDANNSGSQRLDSSRLMERMAGVQGHIELLLVQRAASINTVSRLRREDSGSSLARAVSTIPFRTCTVVGSIYMNMFLLRKPADDSVFDWMVEQVKNDLENAGSVVFELSTLDRLFWMLYVAGCAAIGRSERAWFRVRLAELRSTLTLHSWDDVKMLLKRLGWVDLPSESLGMSLWEELNGPGSTESLSC